MYNYSEIRNTAKCIYSNAVYSIRGKKKICVYEITTNEYVVFVVDNFICSNSFDNKQAALDKARFYVKYYSI